MEMNFLRGTGVAIVTPFNPDASVDYTALRHLVNNHIEQGIDYIVALGTTGESVTLSKQEKIDITQCIKETTANRIPLVLGMGGNNTNQLVTDLKETDLSGYQAILSVSPYYNKPTQQGLIAHYTALADVSPLPIILYNVPARTSSNMLASTSLTLARHHNIVGIKEASGNLEQCADIIKNRPDGFYVLSGDDAFTLPLIALGGDGVISVVANACPGIFANMVRHALQGDFTSAQKNHYLLSSMLPLLFTDGNPAGIKCLLNLMGKCGATVRLPLLEVTAPTRESLHTEYEKLKKATTK